MKTCLNRLIGRCKDVCEMDYDSNHHPNNYDCKEYREVNIMEFEVKEKNKRSRLRLVEPVEQFASVFKSNSDSEELLKKLM